MHQLQIFNSVKNLIDMNAKLVSDLHRLQGEYLRGYQDGMEGHAAIHGRTNVSGGGGGGSAFAYHDEKNQKEYPNDKTKD